MFFVSSIIHFEFHSYFLIFSKCLSKMLKIKVIESISLSFIAVFEKQSLEYPHRRYITVSCIRRDALLHLWFFYLRSQKSWYHLWSYKNQYHLRSNEPESEPSENMPVATVPLSFEGKISATFSLLSTLWFDLTKTIINKNYSM